MRRRTVLLTAVALGVGYAVWHLPVTRRFIVDRAGGRGTP